MTRLTLDTHRLWGHRDQLRQVETLAGPAVRTVAAHFGRPLPTLRITLTTPAGLVELASRAQHAIAPRGGHRDGLAAARRRARGVSGITCMHPDGGVLVLLNADARDMRSTESAAVLLVHELVHADQMGRYGVREELTAYLRGELPPHRARATDDLMDSHETEAHRLESVLAARVLSGGTR